MNKSYALYHYSVFADDGESLMPMPHAYLHDHYRVPVRKMLPDYKVFVDKGQSRMFTQETIPKYILSKMVMADAVSQSDTLTEDSKLYQIDMFIYKNSKGEPMGKTDRGMGDVAWRASETMYIVVLNDEELDKLKGLPV